MDKKTMARRPIALGALGLAVAAGMVAAFGAPQPARAQPGQLPCVGMLQEVSVPIVPGIEVAGLTATLRDVPEQNGGEPVQVVDLSWSLANTTSDIVLCYWVGLKTPGDDSYPGTAIFLLPGDAEVEATYPPVGFGGTLCFLVVPVVEVGRGEPDEVCANVTRPQLISSSGSVRPTPTVSPTPTVPVVPGPPDTGSGAADAGADTPGGAAAFAGAALIVAAAGVVFVRRRRSAVGAE